MVNDPYQVLGISQNATPEEIKKAYRRKAKEFHPDLHPNDPAAAQKMNEVNEAYDMLTNPEKYASRRAQRQGGSAYASQSQQQYNQQHSGFQGAGGWYSDFGSFDFEDIFGFGTYSQQTRGPEVEPEDSPQIQWAVQAIQAGQHQAALQLLSQVLSTGRNARWYYLSGLANKELGNTMLALEQLQRAVQMDPNKPAYHQALQQLRQAEQSYRQNGQGFNMEAMDMQRMCMNCCAIQMCCPFGRC